MLIIESKKLFKKYIKNLWLSLSKKNWILIVVYLIMGWQIIYGHPWEKPRVYFCWDKQLANIEKLIKAKKYFQALENIKQTESSIENKYISALMKVLCKKNLSSKEARNQIAVLKTKIIKSRAERLDALNNIKKWEKIASELVNYRDAYLELCKYYWQIGNDEEAKIAWQKARDLDPNNKQVIAIKNLFDNK